MGLKNRRRKIAISILFSLIITCSIFSRGSAQPIENYLPSGSGLTPNTSTIIKTVKIPVGKYHGIPNISIPIYTIKLKGYQYPIAISYNGSGIKVDEESGSVGLGWKIDLTGQIIQEIRGNNDLPGNLPGFYFNTNPELVDKIPYPTYQTYYKITHFKTCYKPQEDINFISPDLSLYNPQTYRYRSCLDETTNYSDYLSHSSTQYLGTEQEPDIYYLNVPGGIASTFMLKRDRSALERKPTDSKIILNSTTTSGNTTYTWNVTDKDGTKYLFNDIEKITISPPGEGLGTSISSNWLVSEIKTTNNEKINFFYTPMHSDFIKNFYGYNEVQDVSGPVIPFPITTQLGTRTLRTQSLDKITFPGGKIEVVYDNRVDIEFEKRIDALNIFSFDNGVYKLINSFKFNYDYFQSVLPANQSLEYGISNDLAAKRLKLVSVTTGPETAPERHRFEYNENLLPRKTSYGRDHWGYYNGRNANQSLIPNESYRILQWGAQENHTLAGADREPDSLYNQCFSLKKVFYPTGGSSEFAYEANDYDIANSMKFNYSDTYAIPDTRSSLKTKIGGGIRLKNVIIKTNDFDPNPLKTSYVYNYYEHLISSYTGQDTLVKRSYGILPSLPSYSTFTYQPSERISFISKRFSSPISDITSSANGIGYSKVIEFNEGANGELLKTEDDFYNKPEVSFDYNFGKIPGLKNGVCNFNGLPLKTVIYKTKNSATKEFQKLSVHATDYHFFRRGEAWSFKYLSGGSNMGFTQLGELSLFFYPVITSDDYNVTKTVDSLYDSNRNIYLVNTTRTSYKANSYNFIDSTMTTTAKNEILKTQVKYPTDFPSNSVYNSMVAKNMLTPIVENETYLNNVKIHSQYTDFLLYNAQNYYPSNKSHSVGYNTPEQDLHFDTYDNSGNITQITANKKTNTYRWGYNKQYPIASITNARDTECYVENFEDSDLNYENSLSKVNSRSHTGKYSGLIFNPNPTELYSLSGNYITLTPGTQRTFIYSGWVYSDGPVAELLLLMNRAGETGYFSYVDAVSTSETGKWTYVKKTLLIPADVVRVKLRVDNNGGGSVWFDDLRIHPLDAQMTTYTYEPLVGMTSEIDSKGKTIFYDYDNSNRLKSVKDGNGNLIKSNTYYYKN